MPNPLLTGAKNADSYGQAQLNPYLATVITKNDSDRFTATSSWVDTNTLSRVVGTGGTIFRGVHLKDEYKKITSAVVSSVVKTALNAYGQHAADVGAHFQDVATCFQDMGGAKNYTHTGVEHRIATNNYSVNANTAVVETPFFNLSAKHTVINTSYFNIVSDLYQHSSKYIWQRAEKHHQIIAGTSSILTGTTENFYQNISEYSNNRSILTYNFTLQVGKPNGFTQGWSDAQVAEVGTVADYSKKDVQFISQGLGGSTEFNKFIEKNGGKDAISNLVSSVGGSKNLNSITNSIGGWSNLKNLTTKMSPDALSGFVKGHPELSSLIKKTPADKLHTTFDRLDNISKAQKAAPSIEPTAGAFNIKAERAIQMVSSTKASIQGQDTELIAAGTTKVSGTMTSVSAINIVEVQANNSIQIQAGSSISISSGVVLINCGRNRLARIPNPTPPTSIPIPKIELPADYPRAELLQTTKAGVFNYGQTAYLQPAVGSAGPTVSAKPNIDKLSTTSSNMITPPTNIPTESDYS